MSRAPLDCRGTAAGFGGAGGAGASPSRVLLAIPQPFYSDRGSPIALREVTRAYLDLGHEVDVVTFPMGEDFSARGLRFFRCGNPLSIRQVPVGFSLRKLLLDVSLSSMIAERLRHSRYSLVHALEEAAFPATWLAKRCGVPALYDMHSRLSAGLSKVAGLGSRWIQRTAVSTEEWLFRNATVIVTSKGLADDIRTAVPSARLFEWQFSGTMPTGGAAPTGAPLRPSLSIAPDDRVVLYSGTFTPYQGIELLLSAAAQVLSRMPSVVFVLVGTEPQEERALRATTRALGIDAGVRIVPRRPREEMPEYLAMADILVSPRVSGGNVPLKIFDYLSADRPIVATDIPTHRTVLDESTALLVPPNADRIAEAVLAVLRDPILEARLRAGTAEYARVRLGWPTFVESVRRIHAAATGDAQLAETPS